MLTFLASGLWHGADWTFLIWGGVHATAQLIENLCSRQLKAVRKTKAGKLVLCLIVFLFCNVAWVFFRAATLQDAVYVITHCMSGGMSPMQYVRDGLADMRIVEIRTFRIMLALGLLFAVDLAAYRGRLKKMWKQMPGAVRVGGYLTMVWVIWMLIPVEGSGQFIYFQF